MVVSLVTGACSDAEVSDTRAIDADGKEVAKVYIDADGTVYLDGEEITLEALDAEFSLLAEAGGLVEYSRANLEVSEPPPSASAVIEAVARVALPVRLVEEPAGPGWPKVAFEGE